MNSWTDLLQHPLVFRLGWTLLHFVWQGAIVGTIAWSLLKFLERGSPQARYATLLVLLAIAAACPIATLAIQQASTTSPSSARSPNPTAASEPTRLQSTTSQLASDVERPGKPMPTEPAAQRDSRRSWQANLSRIAPATLPWLVVAWCCGVILLALRMAGGWWQARMLRKRHVEPLRAAWQPAVDRLAHALQVHRTVRFLESSLAHTPLTVGCLRPVVLVPVSVLTGLSHAEIQCLLAHELAHIRRHDYLANLLQCAMEVLLFYHPVVWWLSRRIRQEREQVCDQMAVRVAGDRVLYSRALLSAATLATRSPSLTLAAGGGDLNQRVRKILGMPGQAAPTSLGAALTGLALVLGSALYLVASSRAADPPAVPGKPTPIKTSSTGKFRLPTIGGQIVDSLGTPLANARVSLRENTQRTTVKGKLVETDDLALTVTGSDGRFRFTDVPAEADHLAIDVIVHADGYAIAWKHLPGRVPQEDVRIAMAPESQLAGQILDQSGSPVSNATVQLNYVTSIRHITQADLDQGRWPRSDDVRYVNLNGMTARPSATTDAQGRFTLKGLPPNAGLGLRVTHPRYLLTDAWAATVAEIDPQDASHAKRLVQTGQLKIALPKGRRLHVQVVYDDTGAPAQGATYPDVLNWNSYPPKFALGPSGTFDVDHLDRREVRLDIYPPEGSNYLALSEQVTFPENTYDLTHVARLPRGAIVSGRVIDQQTGEGIADVPLYALGGPKPQNPTHLPHPNQPFRTQKDGTFRIAVLPGEATIVVHGKVPGYRTPQRSGTITPDGPAIKQTVTAALDRPVTGVLLKLQRAPVVRGIVRDHEGKPAPDVSITAQIPLAANSYRPLDQRADDQGHFVLKDIDTWDPDVVPRPIEVIFLDRKRNLGTIVLLDPPAGKNASDGTLDVRLQPLGSVTAQCINADTRQPVSGVRAQLYKRDAGPDARTYQAAGPQLSSDQNGRFELQGVLDGAEYFVAITDSRFRRSNGLDTQFSGKSGQRHDLGQLKLFPMEPPAAEQLPQIQAPPVDGLSGDDAYQRLATQYKLNFAAYRAAIDKTTVGRDRDYLVARREPTPAYADAFRKLAESHRNSDVELRSLIWILDCTLIAGTEKKVLPLKQPAARRLLEAYINRQQLADCVEGLLIYSNNSTNPKDQTLATAERLLKDNPHREVQGRTCYAAARRLALDPYATPSPPERARAIEYLKRVINEFSDLPDWRRGTLGEAAKRDLFELEHLVVGAPAPETTGTDVDHRPMSLSDFRGKVVVLDFWGTWCGPCLGELPQLSALATEFGDRIAVLGVISDPPDKASQAVFQHKLRFRNWVDGDDRNGPIVTLWNVHSWPKIYVLDQQGVIRYKDLQPSALRDAVWQLLSTQKTSELPNGSGRGSLDSK